MRPSVFRSLLQLSTLTALIATASCAADAPPGDDAPAATDESPHIPVSGDDSPVPPVTGFSATPLSPFDASISWTCAQHATSHQLLRSIGNGPDTVIAVVPACQPGSSRTITDAAMKPGFSHCYHVLASNDASQNVSPTKCFTAAMDTTPPAAPTVTVDHADPEAITVRYIDNANNETGYRFYIAPQGQEPALVDAINRPNIAPDRGTGTAATYEFVPLTPSTTYTIAVEAIHENAPAKTRTTITATTKAFPPSAPGNVHLVSTFVPDPVNPSTLVNMELDWTPASNATSYEISTDGPNLTPTTIQAIPNKATYQVRYNGHPNNSTARYCFTLTAVSSAGRTAAQPVCYLGTTLSNFYPLRLQPNNLHQLAVQLPGRTVQSISFLNSANSTSVFDGFYILPQASSTPADCNDPSKAVFIPQNGAITGANITKILGPQPIANQILLQGCPNEQGATAAVPILLVTFAS